MSQSEASVGGIPHFPSQQDVRCRAPPPLWSHLGATQQQCEVTAPSAGLCGNQQAGTKSSQMTDEL